MTLNDAKYLGDAQPFSETDSKELRRLSHDLNNALEIIVQASYLVGTTELSEPAGQWLKLLDQGAQQAAELNRQLRDYVRLRS